MKPTPQEINDEIAELQRMKTIIPQRSIFGDDNRAKIEAEIAVLQNNLSERQIERYDGEPEWDSAIYARQWLDGEALDGSMSSNWRPLTEKRS